MKQQIDEQFLRGLGFLPDGDEQNGELGLYLFDVGVDEVGGMDEEPSHQIVFNLADQELFLEAYDGNCKTLSVTQIPTPATQEAMITLLKGLGAYRQQLMDHVEQELAKQMPSVQVIRFEYATICSGKSEVVVYGSGSDWMVQYAKVTNHAGGWRKWFAHRTKAEEYAIQMAAHDYEGMHYHRNNVEADPLGG